MATIKDIARLAGVSHGTVSNVLSQRGNVSVKKINAVKAAAAQLGYQGNAQAKTLRVGTSNAFALVIPDMRAERYHELYSGISRLLSEKNYTLEVFLTYDREEIEKKQLETLATRRCQGVIIVSCLTDAVTYYDRLNIPPEKILFVYRRPANAIEFCDIDMAVMARHIGEELNRNQFTRIGVFTDVSSHSNINDFIHALKEKTSEKATLHHVSSSDAEAHKAAYDFCKSEKLDAIVCSDFEKVRHIRNAYYLGHKHTCPPVYTLSGEGLRSEPDLFCYSISYENLGKNVASSLIYHPEKKEIIEPVIFEPPAKLFNNQLIREDKNNITMLTIDSPSTNALEKLLPHFKKMTGITVDIIRYPFEKIVKITEENKRHLDCDVLRIDMATLPKLAENLFEPLNNISPELLSILNDFPENIVKHYSNVAGNYYTLPFDPSIQILFYRRDIFENQKVKRIYFERFHQEMHLPKNFEQFDRLSMFFSELREKGEIGTYGSCATIGGVETLATEFLLRYYSLGGRLLHPKSLPELTLEIAISALSEYKKSLEHSQCLESNWWHESVASFERGDVAMLIVYMNLFTDVAHSEIFPLTGYAPVPGGTPLAGGGAIGISKHSKNKYQSALFLQWLFSDTIMEQIVLLGGGSASQKQFHNRKIMDTYSWIKLALTSSISSIRETITVEDVSFDLFHAENIIGQHIKEVLKGNLNVERAIFQINQKLAAMS